MDEMQLSELLRSEEYDKLGEMLVTLEKEELTGFLAALGEDEHGKLCRNLGGDVVAELVKKLGDSAEKQRVLSALGESDLDDVKNELTPGETVEIIEGLSSGVAAKMADAEEIELLLHEKNFALLKPMLSTYNGTDLAEILDEISEEDLAPVFRILPKELAAETFVDMEPDAKENLIRRLNDIELKAVMDELFLDDAVDLVEEMPANVVKRLIKSSSPETRAYINELLKYPKDSAGSIMTIEFVSLGAGMTVSQAFDRIRRTGVDSETIYTMYVTDEKKKLIGTVSAKELLLAPPDAKIVDIMEKNVICVDTLTDKEDVARRFSSYGFLALPVVDEEKRLVGIVTVDDAMTVIEEENTEDVKRMAGIVPDNKPYLKTSVLSIWKSRVPWLLILMVSATFTGLIINTFEARLNAISTVLFACVPMLMDTGGNSGSQSSVTVIRSLALGDLKTRDTGKVLWKEFRVSVLLALTLAAACFCKLMLIDNLIFGYKSYTPRLCAVVSLAMFFTIIIAKLVGCLLPMAVKKCRLDPAAVASPFITTIVDALSLIIFCTIAVNVL